MLKLYFHISDKLSTSSAINKVKYVFWAYVKFIKENKSPSAVWKII